MTKAIGINRAKRQKISPAVRLLLAAGLAGGLASQGCSTAPLSAAADPSDGVSYITTAKYHGEAVAGFEVSVAAAPDLAAWGRHAADLCADWYPRIAEILGVEESLTNRTIHLVIRPMSGVANTDPRIGRISFSSKYIRSFSNDWGLVVHELAHTVQSFGRNPPFQTPNDPPPENPSTTNHAPDAVWLTEGIADYVRLGFFEPETRIPRINPNTARYTDSYKVTATFLRWIAKNHDPNVVKELNRALRDGTCTLDSFKLFTGKTIDELWAEFTAALRAKKVSV